MTSTVTAQIVISPVAPQTTEVPFGVSGTYTLIPALQFVDDGGTSYTPIPPSSITPIGSTPFAFTHPGMTAGEHSLVVSDTVSGQIGATSYLVDATGGTSTQAAFPPSGNTSLTTILYAYPYEEYADDDNIQALFFAYNQIAQSYMDWFNAVQLPVYTGPLISGALLDWVGAGLYGIVRPNLAFTTTASGGTLGTYPLAAAPPLDAAKTSATSQLYVVTDDIYKRILTWNLYKGDGKVFTVRWLKRRILRFLAGVNGTDVNVADTRQISVTFTGTTTVTITVNTGAVPTTYAQVFRAAIISGALPLPFQYNYSIVIGS